MRQSLLLFEKKAMGFRKKFITRLVHSMLNLTCKIDIAPIVSRSLRISGCRVLRRKRQPEIRLRWKATRFVRYRFLTILFIKKSVFHACDRKVGRNMWWDDTVCVFINCLLLSLCLVYFRKNSKVQKRGKVNLIGRLQLLTEKAKQEENDGIVALRILRIQVRKNSSDYAYLS